MRISYAIPVCNEHIEVNRLINFLLEYKQSQDEIVVQCDQGNTTKEVYEVLSNFGDKIKVCQIPLNRDFAFFKNTLKSHCTGEWIFQIDADEMLSTWLMQNIHTILQDNPTIHLFCVPRINTVDGLTQDHIDMWKWHVNHNGWVNFPDYQTRIIQNSPKIKWVGKVHEIIYGYQNHALLPIDEEYCILHHKHIKRQEEQNTLYSKI
jgi:glycosyltransferase involved in cell wall biosynthesis